MLMEPFCSSSSLCRPHQARSAARPVAARKCPSRGVVEGPVAPPGCILPAAPSLPSLLRDFVDHLARSTHRRTLSCTAAHRVVISRHRPSFLTMSFQHGSCCCLPAKAAAVRPHRLARFVTRYRRLFRLGLGSESTITKIHQWAWSWLMVDSEASRAAVRRRFRRLLGEAEYHALVKAAAEGLAVVTLGRDLGYEFKSRDLGRQNHGHCGEARPRQGAPQVQCVSRGPSTEPSSKSARSRERRIPPTC